MAAVVAGEVDPIIRLDELFIRSVVVFSPAVLDVTRRGSYPGTEVIAHHPPVHVHGILELLPVPRMQSFHRSARSIALNLDVGQLAEFGLVLNSVAGNQDAIFGENLCARIPEQVDRPLDDESEASVDVVILLP